MILLHSERLALKNYQRNVTPLAIFSFIICNTLQDKHLYLRMYTLGHHTQANQLQKTLCQTIVSTTMNFYMFIYNELLQDYSIVTTLPQCLPLILHANCMSLGIIVTCLCGSCTSLHLQKGTPNLPPQPHAVLILHLLGFSSMITHAVVPPSQPRRMAISVLEALLFSGII